MEYYNILGIPKNSNQQQIKQAYRKLALKYHPDKNINKQQAKIKFTQISQAYTILNNPQKRQYYDKYGKSDIDINNFQEFQQFMSDFGFFQEFLDDFLAFDDLTQLNKMFASLNVKKGNKKGRANKRKNGGGGGLKMEQIQQIFDTLMGDPFSGLKKKQKKKPKQQSQQQDDEDLTQQQMKILQFGNQNIQKKKVKKKTITICRIDQQKIESDQILIHFSQKHMNQFQLWLKNKTIKD